MTEDKPETTHVFWVPDLDGSIDLSEVAEIVQNAAPWEQEATIEVCRVEEVLEREEPLGPEGTLTKVVDEATGDLIGHAEVSYNEDGTGTVHIYGLHHNPEEQP